MSNLVPYRSTPLLPSRPSREVRQVLAIVDGHELVARARVEAAVRTTVHALAGAAMISQAAGVLAAADPLANDALSTIAGAGIAKIADILRSSL